MAKTIKWLWAIVIVFAAGIVAFIYSGLYPVGADVPHNAATNWILATLRDRSIARASEGIRVPNLNDPALLLKGGPDYNEMCVACHLKPSRKASDLSAGLYPRPPNLSEMAGDPRRQFWVIKHGIKASGMPAWGATHSDARIWAMVAFLQKLPELTPVQYQVLTTRDKDKEKGHH